MSGNSWRSILRTNLSTTNMRYLAVPSYFFLFHNSERARWSSNLFAFAVFLDSREVDFILLERASTRKEARKGERNLWHSGPLENLKTEKTATKQEAYKGWESKHPDILQRKGPLVLTNRQYPPEGGNLHQFCFSRPKASSKDLRRNAIERAVGHHLSHGTTRDQTCDQEYNQHRKYHGQNCGEEQWLLPIRSNLEHIAIRLEKGNLVVNLISKLA